MPAHLRKRIISRDNEVFQYRKIPCFHEQNESEPENDPMRVSRKETYVAPVYLEVKREGQTQRSGARGMKKGSFLRRSKPIVNT